MQRVRLDRAEKSRRRGGVLVGALIMVMVVAGLTAAFFQINASVTRRQAQSIDTKAAFYMAEAGLAEAYAGLLISKSGDVGSEENPVRFGEGLFWVEATEIDDDTTGLRSTGMVGSGKAVLSFVARSEEETVASLGMFSNQPMTLAPGSRIDAYDSSEETYTPRGSVPVAAEGTGLQVQVGGLGLSAGGSTEPTATESEHASPQSPSGRVLTARLGSNAGVTVSGTVASPTTIQGDIKAGPGYDADITGEVTVTGEVEPYLAATELPPVTVPSYSAVSSVDHTLATPLVLTPNEEYMVSMRAGPNTQVVLEGPASLVVDDLTLEAGAELTLDTNNGPINLYINDSLQLAATSSVLTPASRSDQVFVQFAGDQNEVYLAGSSQFHGVVYAPATEVVLGSDFEVFGALIADQLTFEGAAQLHYDLHLADLSLGRSLPSLVSWRILEIGNEGFDPFKTLNVNPAVLPAPAAGHRDQTLDLTYVDTVGVTRTYSGPESAFDWTTVQDVVLGSRDGNLIQPDVSLASNGLGQAVNNVAQGLGLR